MAEDEHGQPVTPAPSRIFLGLEKVEGSELETQRLLEEAPSMVTVHEERDGEGLVAEAMKVDGSAHDAAVGAVLREVQEPKNVKGPPIEGSAGQDAALKQARQVEIQTELTSSMSFFVDVFVVRKTARQSCSWSPRRQTCGQGAAPCPWPSRWPSASSPCRGARRIQ